ADLVRIVCGDDLSDPAMFEEQELSAPFTGTHQGRFQPIHTGSYVEIDQAPCLNALESFTIQAMVFPTALPKGPVKPLAFSHCGPPDSNQHLISRWNPATQAGWVLFIDEHNCPAFRMSDGKSVQQTTLPCPLVERQWFRIVASYDATHRTIRIAADRVTRTP